MPPRLPDRDRNSLSPEMRREIESRLDSTVNRTGSAANALIRYLKQAIWVLSALIILGFLVDYVRLRASAAPTATVSIKRYYAVGLKNGKTEMYYAEPETQTCVNAVFPHLGHWPCWYLRRHNVKEISL